MLDARATGRGRDVDVNLYDAALAMLSYRATWYLSAGVPVERQPLSAHPSVVPFQFFATGDGHGAVACAKGKFFRALVDGLGLTGLGDDPRFADFGARWEHRRELVDILGAAFAARTTEEYVARSAVASRSPPCGGAMARSTWTS